MKTFIMKDFPGRGEVWLVNWNPARGSEQADRRPALVIQNDIGNEKAPTTIVAAISSSVRIYPMNVKINPPEAKLDHTSIIKTPDTDHLEETAGKALRPAQQGQHG